ncbi:MAG: TIGR01212 family radical SAM protein [Candidatus Omnitrophica bacterium]|nr:TIGR01212 family radical SAM protein [Candidatus Omnitrophota bacterium]
MKQNSTAINSIPRQDYFYSFNKYLKERFGERVHRISIDAGFNCPNIDGMLSNKGCIYCNNKGFVRYDGRTKTVEEQIEESMEFYHRHMGVNKFIAYFQAFSNTYADVKTLQKQYDVIRKFPAIVGLFISTRPDCVDRKKINLIAQYSHDYLVWMEYGLQTTHDPILKQINRNHTYEDFLKACELTRKHNVNVGVHIILGLPSQKHEEMMLDAKRLAGLDIQGIKFHVLHVLKNTRLERLYESGKIQLLTKNEYIPILCDFLEQIPKSVIILRLVSSASRDYLIAPDWINNKGTLKEDIIREFKRRGTCQGKNGSIKGTF